MSDRYEVCCGMVWDSEEKRAISVNELVEILNKKETLPSENKQITNWKIHYTWIREDQLWFIYKGSSKGFLENDLYLHKDGMTHPICGRSNFFNSKEEAELFLSNWLNKKDLAISSK